MIYFAQAGSSGPIKIGRASNPSRRVSDLHTANPHGVTLIGAFDPGPAMLLDAYSADKAAERWLHKIFAAHRMNGEWFRPHGDVVSYIDGVLRNPSSWAGDSCPLEIAKAASAPQPKPSVSQEVTWMTEPILRHGVTRISDAMVDAGVFVIRCGYGMPTSDHIARSFISAIPHGFRDVLHLASCMTAVAVGLGVQFDAPSRPRSPLVIVGTDSTSNANVAHLINVDDSDIRPEPERGTIYTGIVEGRQVSLSKYLVARTTVADDVASQVAQPAAAP